MSSDGALDGFALELEGDGTGGFYRVRNRKDQINRSAIINRGEKFSVIADLVEVVHGTLKPGGDAGAIIVADFQFIPKRGRRYKGAIINFQFESDDPSVEVSVEKIAPLSRWALNPTTRNDKFSLSFKPSIEAIPGVGNVSLGELSSSQKQDKLFHTEVEGSMRLETRDEGGKDTAQWVLGENEAQKTGIARALRVAIVVKRAILNASDGEMIKLSIDEGPTFRVTVEAVAEVPIMSLGWAEEKFEILRKKVPVDDAVVFKPGKNLESGLFDFSKTALLAEDLKKVMAMSLYQSFEGLAEHKEAPEGHEHLKE
ncbi:hypothetical protein G7Y89_g6886 [Cudoniella acicularis]|uniref:Uncharacterized protein n=1 Tax=Cudoniella acicularis TaxID=354080 RepID=A0A8H4RL45_9HELO|nr:hypothetical protein G7Y89_g6886 [Cudoniella acicularis]